MSITAAIIVMCIMAAVIVALAYVRAMPPVPDFRTTDQMNADEARRAQARKTKAWIDSQWDVRT